MDEALQKHRNGEIGFNEACRRFNIPKPTLRRHLKGLNKRTKFGKPNDMPPDMEQILAQHLRNLGSCSFGLSTTEFRKLAFKLAEKFQLPHRFNKEKKIAGKKWYYRFMKEHPDLSLRIPEPTSMGRSKGFNEGLWPCDRNVIKEENFVASVCISDPSNQEISDQTE